MNAPPSPKPGFVLDLSGIDLGPEPDPEPEADRFARMLAGDRDDDDIAWVSADPDRRKRFDAAVEAKRAAEEAERRARWEAEAPAREAAEPECKAEEDRRRAEQARRAAEHAAAERERLATIDRTPLIDALKIVDLDPVHHPKRNERDLRIQAVEQGQWFFTYIICPNPNCRASGSTLRQNSDGSLLVMCGGKRRGDESIECRGPSTLSAMVEALVEEKHDEEDEYEDDDLIETGLDALFASPVMEPYWGDEEVGVLAVRGQALGIVGRDGTGKSTLSHQLVKGSLGLPGYEELAGFPLRPVPDDRRVLLLALDRPQQIRAAFARGIDRDDPVARAALRDRLVWVSQLPDGLVLASPEGAAWLLEVCRRSNVGRVVVDSPKDAVDGDLSTPTVGAAYARFRGALVSDGVDVIDLLHPVKSQASNPRLESIAGSGSLYRGLGSVIFLVGEPGGTRVQVHHVKPIQEPVEPFTVLHDHATGRSFNEDEAQARCDLQVVARLLADRGGEAAPGEVAAALDISPNAVKARMDELAARGWITDNGKGTRAKRYLLPEGAD